MIRIKTLLMFGPVAALLFWLGVGVLGFFVPGYHSVHQTVSEIGEVGSPMRVPFTLTLVATALCLMFFALGLRRAASDRGHSLVSVVFVVAMGLSVAGVGIFAYPHPLHNIFGLSELIGLQAPAVLALSWRKDAQRQVARFSWSMYSVVILANLANLSVLDRQGALWALERPIYGIVQRALFAAWFVWCAGIGLVMLRLESHPGASSSER